MSCSSVFRVRRAAAAVFAASVVLAGPISIASAASTEPTVVPVTVSSTRVWTDAGVTVRAGDSVEVAATGQIHFGGPPIDRIGPAGIAWGPSCSVIAKSVVGWTARGLACWSLIGRVGSSPPFELGGTQTVRMPRSGELFLGVNDNYLVDNSGSWSAIATVTPRPPATAPKDTSSSTHLAVIVAATGALLAALFVLVARRRRSAAARRAAALEEVPERPAPVPAAVAAGISADILPEPRGHAEPAPVVAPVIQGEPTETNIFAVEFPDLSSLRVAYNYFPEGTLVRWLVQQGARVAATGEFVASGGGNVIHTAEIALGVELERRPDGADVDFTWEVGGVPFGYSVRRDPGA